MMLKDFQMSQKAFRGLDEAMCSFLCSSKAFGGELSTGELAFCCTRTLCLPPKETISVGLIDRPDLWPHWNDIFVVIFCVFVEGCHGRAQTSGARVWGCRREVAGAECPLHSTLCFLGLSALPTLPGLGRASKLSRSRTRGYQSRCRVTQWQCFYITVFLSTRCHLAPGCFWSKDIRVCIILTLSQIQKGLQATKLSGQSFWSTADPKHASSSTLAPMRKIGVPTHSLLTQIIFLTAQGIVCKFCASGNTKGCYSEVDYCKSTLDKCYTYVGYLGKIWEWKTNGM